MIQPLWRTVWRFLENLKIELPYDPATPLLGIYPEKTIWENRKHQKKKMENNHTERIAGEISMAETSEEG